MIKYIDADKLREKIYAEDTVSLAHGSSPEFDQGCHYAFLTVLSFLDFLQQEQPDVNLEKEIDLFVHGWSIDEFLGLVNDEGWSVTVGDIKNVARHFYELGQQEMRYRITNPEYNAKVVERLKSEYPMIKEK